MIVAVSETKELLARWIRRRSGDEAPDPKQRLVTYQSLLPGYLPTDYSEGLMFISRLAGLYDNQILSAEPPLPPIAGGLGHIGSYPIINLLFGLQLSHSNVIDEYIDSEKTYPTGLAPIGCDSLGNMVLLDFTERGNGRILFWWVNGDRSPDEQGRPGRGNIFLLAYSFTDLLRRMRPSSDVDDESPPVGNVSRLA